MDNKNPLSGSTLADVFTNGTHNYFLYSRIDTFYVILRETLDEDEYRLHVGYGNANMNIAWSDPTAVTPYARQGEMTDAQKKLYLCAYRGFDGLSDRDFS